MSEGISHTHFEREVSASRIQSLTAQRMLLSKRTKPCFYIEALADVTELMSMRHSLKRAYGVKITTNAFYIEAMGRAAARFALMVGRLQGDVIRIADSVNVGFAVNAPHGLVVPVIKDVEDKRLREIAVFEQELTAKARSNRLSLADLDGETIALSNLGVYAVDSFIAIVPPRATSILAVGNPYREAVFSGNRFFERRKVSLTVAADARIVTYDYAAGFLACVVGLLENPQRLVPNDNGV